MKEKEPIASNTDYGRDEDSADVSTSLACCCLVLFSVLWLSCFVLFVWLLLLCWLCEPDEHSASQFTLPTVYMVYIFSLLDDHSASQFTLPTVYMVSC